MSVYANFDPDTGVYRGAPPGGRIRPALPSAGSPYSQAQWQQLRPAQRKGFSNRGEYLRWWNRSVKPKLQQKPKGQTNRTNPQTGNPESIAAVDNSIMDLPQKESATRVSPRSTGRFRSVSASLRARRRRRPKSWRP